MALSQKIIIIIIISLSLLVSACSGKEAYLISRTLLGYIPPPDVPTVMAQLKEELIRCEKTGGEFCEKQAMEYVRTVNETLERNPRTGVVVITRVDDEVEIEYDAEGKDAPVKDQEIDEN